MTNSRQTPTHFFPDLVSEFVVWTRLTMEPPRSGQVSGPRVSMDLHVGFMTRENLSTDEEERRLSRRQGDHVAETKIFIWIGNVVSRALVKGCWAFFNLLLPFLAHD